MALTLISQPSAVVSVNDNNEFVYQVSAGNFYVGSNGATPFGLLKLFINDTTATAIPSISVGDIIHVTDSTSIYFGSHVVTEIIGSAPYYVQVVVNTVYVGVYAPATFNNAMVFNNFICELNTILISTPVWTFENKIANVSYDIKNNLITLNVNEYVRSAFSSGINAVTIDISQGSIFPQILPVTFVNTVLSSAEVQPIFKVSGSPVVPKIVETAKTIILFKAFRTFISNSSRQNVSTPSVAEIYKIVDSNYTQTGSIPTNILSYQSVELYNGCFKDALNIVYLNFAGGIRNYVVFNDIAISREFDNEIRFKNNNLAEFIQSVEHYESYEVSCENVRMTHSESIDQMIASPLTWLSDSNGNLTPIVIDKSSFLKYKSYDESLNFSFSFRKSETKQSQTN